MVKYLKILAKSVLYGLVGIFLLIFTFILLLRAPTNQMLLANYFKPIIQRELGYPVDLKGIQVKFFDELSISGLRVQDPWGKEMIYIEHLDDLENIRTQLEEGIGEPIENRFQAPHYTFV